MGLIKLGSDLPGLLLADGLRLQGYGHQAAHGEKDSLFHDVLLLNLLY
jgi:hypothetical protein